MQPELGSTRPWLSGANLCGQASTKADHSVGTALGLLFAGSGLCHTARSRPQTLIWTGVRPDREEALPRGIQAPSVVPADDDADADDADDDSNMQVSACFMERKSGDDAADDC